MSTFKGTGGGLWLDESVKKASDPRPRWKGSFTCKCGHKTNLRGFGRDQLRSEHPRAPLISLRVAKRDE